MDAEKMKPRVLLQQGWHQKGHLALPQSFAPKPLVIGKSRGSPPTQVYLNNGR